MTVDREARDRLVDVIEDFLSGKTTIDEFDTSMQVVFLATRDRTIRSLFACLASVDDSCEDSNSKVQFDKCEWNQFQRFVLLLKSDAHLETRYDWRWSRFQVVAGAAFLLFLYCATFVGFNWRLLLLSIPFGLVSIGLSYCLDRSAREPTPREVGLYPFASFSEIRAVRRSVDGFQKKPYPVDMKGPAGTSGMWRFVSALPFYAMWCALSPVALFRQIFPPAETKTRVILP